MNVIEAVELTNFRSHDKFKLDCRKPTTLIIGENGSGKTSVLEAIYIALQGKSFRNVDRELVKRGEEFYRIVLKYVGGEEVQVGYDGRKVFKIEDKKFGRLPKKYRYPVVCFLPEDLNLISSSPSRRREFFDRWISQVDESYRAALLKYNKALKQRNELIKSGGSRSQAFAWDVLLARYGSELTGKRFGMIGDINEKLTKVYRTIANNTDKIEIDFSSEVLGEDESRYVARLDSAWEKDRIASHTTVGAHRDNYVFMFNGKDAEGSASRGESRSVILALRFIEARRIREIIGREPVVLLDDIFSELDVTRQKYLVDNFKQHQVIITSVDVPEEIKGKLQV